MSPESIRLLVACTGGLYLVEGHRVRAINVTHAPFFGITWSADEIFVMCCRAEGTALNEILLVLDRGLRLIDEVRLPARNTHQTLWWRGGLYLTWPNDDEVACLTAVGRRTAFRADVGPLPKGSSHINSIWAGPAGLCIVEHRQSTKFDRPSRINLLTHDAKTVVRAFDVGQSAHNAFIEGDRLYFCDSERGALCEVDVTSGRSVRTARLGPWFLRGLARPPGHFVVGESTYTAREHRARTTSHVVVLNDDLDPVFRVTLPGAGVLQDLRVLDQPDAAHNGIVMRLRGLPLLG